MSDSDDDNLEDTQLNAYIYSWSYCDEDTDEGMRCFIRAYGITTTDGKKDESKKKILDRGYENVYILVENFSPYCYLQLPQVIDNNNFEWNDVNIKFLYDKLSNMCGKKDFKPVTYRLSYKRKLYFANKKPKKVDGKYIDKTFPYLFLTFNSTKALINFGYRLKKPIDVYNIGRNITLKIHEGDYSADPIMKMTAVRKLKLTGWLSLTGKEIRKEKESMFDRELIVTYKNLNPVDIKKIAMPKVMCFDGEMNSKAITAMPNAKLDSDKCFQISCVFSRNTKYNPKNNYYEKILLTLGSPDPIDGTEIRKFKSEGDLLIGFSKLIREENPNVCIGYNIFGFDIEYMYERAKHCMVEKEFLQNSCLLNKPAYIHDRDKWASQAFGKQNIIRFESEGRLFFDLCPFIKRNYKLVNYKLGTVAQHFKVGEKDPLKPKDIFRCYREFTGPSLSRVGFYCVVDSLVTTYIWEKLFLWISVSEESVVNRVPIITLYTKGQQIKMYSQVYEHCMYHNYVVESNGYQSAENEHYTGALVLDAVVGLHNKVVSLDFASLYPSIMISHNIDYSTCVQDDNIPDEDCHVFKWSEHVNCEHDHKHVEKEEKKQARKERIAKNKIEKEKKKEEKEAKKIKKEIDRIRKIVNKNKTKKDEDKTELDFFDETDEDTEHIREQIREKERDKIDEKKMKEKEKEKEDKKLLGTVKIDMDGKKVENAEDQVSSIKKVCGHFKYRFLKHEVSEMGVIPSLLQKLLKQRKDTRKVLKEIVDVKIPEIAKVINEMKMKKDSEKKEEIYKRMEEIKKKEEEMEELETESVVLNKRQLNYKVSANSMYGAMGVKRGYLPFLPGAMCVTYVGRISIGKTVELVVTVYKGKVIYGDSVVKDTGILCKYEKTGNEYITYKCIEEIGDEIKDNKWIPYHGDKEYRKTNLMVWSDKGFTKINKVIRHKTDKKIMRVLTHTGVVDVTEDHSLLTKKGEKISPKDTKIGTELLTYKLPEKHIDYGSKKDEIDMIFIDEKEDKKEEIKNNLNYNVSIGEAFVWGLFWADGSCGTYQTNSGEKNTWAINNQDYKLLEKTKKILEEIEPHFKSFNILETMESSNVYKLVPFQGGTSNSHYHIKNLVLKYRNLMYYSGERTGENKDGPKAYKRIPDVILNAPIEIKKSFMKGYYAGDGDKGSSHRYDNLGKIGSCGLYYLSHSLGYNMSINTRKDKQEVYRMTGSKTKFRKKEEKVKKIYEIKNYNDYVYDLETENHHFSAGIGKLIIHNTDSVMVVFEDSDLKKLGDIARSISEHSTRIFPSPMKLEYEGKIYYKYLLLSKKRYALRICDESGNISPDIESKGIVLSRRDNSKFLKQVYKSTIEHIFDEKSMIEVLSNIVDYINKLFSRFYSYKDFTITKGLTRDDYKVKPAHCILAEKMRSRGIAVQVGSKISYIITTMAGNKYNVRQKDKIEDEDYFAEWKEILRVDFLYLFEKQAIKPIDEVLEAVYQVFRTSEVSFMKQQFQLRRQKEKMVKRIEEFGIPRIVFKEEKEDEEETPIRVSKDKKKVIKLNKKS
jgi:DNA polymerase elongation subunit (family B)